MVLLLLHIRLSGLKGEREYGRGADPFATMTLFNSASSSASSSSEEEGRDDNEDDIPVRAAVSDIEPDLDLDLELPRLLLLLLLVLAVATDSTDPRRRGGNAAHADTGTAGKFGIAMHMLSGLGIGMRVAENGIAMLSGLGLSLSLSLSLSAQEKGATAVPGPGRSAGVCGVSSPTSSSAPTASRCHRICDRSEESCAHTRFSDFAWRKASRSKVDEDGVPGECGEVGLLLLLLSSDEGAAAAVVGVEVEVEVVEQVVISLDNAGLGGRILVSDILGSGWAWSGTRRSSGSGDGDGEERNAVCLRCCFCRCRWVFSMSSSQQPSVGLSGRTQRSLDVRGLLLASLSPLLLADCGNTSSAANSGRPENETFFFFSFFKGDLFATALSLVWV